MTVIKSFTHRSIHTNAQGTNKILILISVVHKAMYDLDLLTSGVEVETDYERKPLPSGFTSVGAFQFDECPHLTGTFYCGRCQSSGIVSKSDLRSIFKDRFALSVAYKTCFFTDFHSFTEQTVNHKISLTRDVSGNNSCLYADTLRCFNNR